MGLFRKFFQSERSGGFVLIGCTVLSLLLANSSAGESYIHFFEKSIGDAFHLPHSIGHWINDGLMAIFFLLVGLEIERELYIGELSSWKNAILPIVAAAGGMLVPALIHFLLNRGTPTAAGFGIPMATDIAFALGILSLAGNRVPIGLKIFLTALAIIDDLGAIVVIAVFYSTDFSFGFLSVSLITWLFLFFGGKKWDLPLWVFLLGGVVMWYTMLRSGVHPTIAGVLLAFAIPFRRKEGGGMSEILQQALHIPVAFFILPLFALANTAIEIPNNPVQLLAAANSMGILLGLVAGKFMGILGFCWLSVRMGMGRLPAGVNWGVLAGAALLGGIGFTMSIFITNLAFSDESLIVSSKMSILLASLVAAILGWSWLRFSVRRLPVSGREEMREEMD